MTFWCGPLLAAALPHVQLYRVTSTSSVEVSKTEVSIKVKVSIFCGYNWIENEVDIW